ncbi:MAG TPA: lipid-binding SYLF domain-containing protein [Terriglobia bacterium]|nr:lipid-binding SYLF domain-containing protein [Terriglobia bacterium]
MKQILAMVVALGSCSCLFARQQDHEADRLQRAAQVIKMVMTMPGPAIPAQLIDHALCIGIIPSAVSIELGLGAHFGRGVLVCRVNHEKTWSAPWMFTVGGASYGLIPEGDSANVIFLVMTRKGERKFMKSGLKVGVDASASSGPVAEKAGITAIPVPRSDLVAYSMRRGRFSGASLEGVILKPDDDADLHLYGHRVGAAEVLTHSSVTPPAAAKPLEEMLARFCSFRSDAALAKF